MKKTREECIEILQKSFDEMDPETQDRVFIACACEHGHTYSPRTLLEAIKDPTSEEGKQFYEAWAELEEHVAAHPEGEAGATLHPDPTGGTTGDS